MRRIRSRSRWTWLSDWRRSRERRRSGSFGRRRSMQRRRNSRGCLRSRLLEPCESMSASRLYVNNGDGDDGVRIDSSARAFPSPRRSLPTFYIFPSIISISSPSRTPSPLYSPSTAAYSIPSSSTPFPPLPICISSLTTTTSHSHRRQAATCISIPSQHSASLFVFFSRPPIVEQSLHIIPSSHTPSSSTHLSSSPLRLPSIDPFYPSSLIIPPLCPTFLPLVSFASWDPAFSS
jgi:hypothetical protein